MMRNEQAAFVRELSEAVIEKILNLIEKEQIPEEWTGIELRRYLADKFQAEVIDRMMSKEDRKAYNRQIASIPQL